MGQASIEKFVEPVVQSLLVIHILPGIWGAAVHGRQKPHRSLGNSGSNRMAPVQNWAAVRFRCRMPAWTSGLACAGLSTGAPDRSAGGL